MQINNNETAISTNDVFKILFECGRDLSRFRYYIYFIGTTVDCIKLRQKIRLIELKLIRNIYLQKLAISQTIKKETSRNETDRLICFCLSAIAYFEVLVKKLNNLTSHFTDGSERLVNIEFDELNELNTDEITILDEISGQNANSQVKKIDNDFKVDLESIKSLKEEIEQLDVNLGRYNVRNESDEFLKNICVFDDDKETLTDTNQVGQKQTNKKTPAKDCKAKKIFKRNKRLCIIVFIFIFCLLVIGVAFGLIYGSKK